MVSLTHVILFSKKCFLFVYMYIDLLKLKANKLFENSDADLPWFLFKEVNLYRILFTVNGRKLFQAKDVVNEELPPLHHQNRIK